jgi:hypothetical protein
MRPVTHIALAQNNQRCIFCAWKLCKKRVDAAYTALTRFLHKKCSSVVTNDRLGRVTRRDSIERERESGDDLFQDLSE